MSKLKLKISITQIGLIIVGMACLATALDDCSGRWFEGLFGKFYHSVTYLTIFTVTLLTCCASTTGKRRAILFGAVIHLVFVLFELLMILGWFGFRDEFYEGFGYEEGIDIASNVAPLTLTVLINVYFIGASFLWWTLFRKKLTANFCDSFVSKVLKPVGMILFDTKWCKVFWYALLAIFVFSLTVSHFYFYQMEYKSELQQKFMRWEIPLTHDFYGYIGMHPHRRYTHYLVSEMFRNEQYVKEQKNVSCTYDHLQEAIHKVTGKNYGYDSDKWKAWYKQKYKKAFKPFELYID